MSIEMQLEEQIERIQRRTDSNHAWLARIDPPVPSNEPILWIRPPWLSIGVVGGICLWLLILWLVGLL